MIIFIASLFHELSCRQIGEHININTCAPLNDIKTETLPAQVHAASMHRHCDPISSIIIISFSSSYHSHHHFQAAALAAAKKAALQIQQNEAAKLRQVFCATSFMMLECFWNVGVNSLLLLLLICAHSLYSFGRFQPHRVFAG